MRVSFYDTPLNLRVPDELKADLQAEAERRDLPLAEVVREVLTEHVERQRPRRARPRPRRR